MRQNNRGVSKIIGVVILVVIVIILSVGVLFTAQSLIGGQQQDMTSGTTDERANFYTHEAQLVNQGNADTVYAISPLGTEYELESAGDLQKILPLKKGSHPGVDQYQIVGERAGQRQLLKTTHFEEGVAPDVVVHDEGDKNYETIQVAINNIDSDTERDISSENPGVIVVQKGVYKENIEVSDNIQLIAEYGTVIQDANPNEDVIDVRGDDVRVQNFHIDGDPNQEETKHYARHGINVRGDGAIIQGNTVYNADSPDVTSSGISVDGEGALIRFNNVYDSENSVYFGEGSAAPSVCGNQFENGIGGYVTRDTQSEVASMNHWNKGVPANLAQNILSDTENEVSEGDELELPGVGKELLEGTNSKVPPEVLGKDAGRAGLPFTGTKIATNEEMNECEVTVELVNTGGSVEIEEIVVEIYGRETTIEVVQEVDLGDKESSDKRNRDNGPVAICNGCDDGTYDKGDSITIDESVQQYPIFDGERPDEGLLVQPSGGSYNPTSFGISSSSGGIPTSTSSTIEDKKEEPEQDEENDPGTVRIELGSKIDIQLADEVSLTPIVTGADPADIEYDWDLGDGSTSSQRKVTHMYEDPGTYTVELIVTDTSTGETDTDSTTVTVEEGKKDVEQIRADEQERLRDLVQEDIDGEGKVLYLENGITYDQLNEIGASDLTIIGSGDDVTLNGPIVVQASGVTFKNVHIDGPLIVNNNNFGLYSSTVENPSGYALEINANGGGFQIGESTLSGANGVSVNADRDVTISDTEITATDMYGVYTGQIIDGVRIRDSTITSETTGVYENLGTSVAYNSVTFNTGKLDIEEQEATPPTISDISVDTPTTGIPTGFSAVIEDPDNFGIKSITWEVDGHKKTISPTDSFRHTFDSPGEYIIKVTATDMFGTTTTESKTVTVEEFELTANAPSTASIGDEVTVTSETNVPDHYIRSIEYDWDDGETDVGNEYYTHTYSEIDTHTVKITATTDAGKTHTITKTIEIVDSPVAEYAIENTVLAGEPLQFNGEYSTAPDGGSLDYSWDMGDGTTYTKESPQHTYDTTGTYTVSLTVEDSDGFTDTMTGKVNVNTFTSSVTGPSELAYNEVGEFSVETGIDKSDVSHYNVDYNGDGYIDETYYSEPFTHNFADHGELTTTVEVVDNSGGISVSTVDVSVADPYEFDLTASAEEAAYGDELTFEVVNENYNGVTYEWDFDDGATATTTDGTVTHKMQNSIGSRVTVTATTESGLTATENVFISGKDAEYTVSTQEEFNKAIQDPGAVIRLQQGNQFNVDKITTDGVRIIGNGVQNELVLSNGPITVTGNDVTLENINIQQRLYNDDIIRMEGSGTEITDSYIRNTYSYDNSGANTVGVYSGTTTITNTELHNDEDNSYSLYVRNDGEVELQNVKMEEFYYKGDRSFGAIDKQAESGQTIEVTDSHIKLVEDNVEVTKSISYDTTLTTSNLLVKGDGTDALSSSATITVQGSGTTFENINFKAYIYNNDVINIQTDNVTVTDSYVHNTYSYDNSGAHTIGIYTGTTTITNTELHNDEDNSYSLYVRNDGVVDLTNVEAEEMYDKGDRSFKSIDKQAESGQTIEVTNNHIRLVEEDVTITKTITHDTTLETKNLNVNGDGTDAIGSSSTVTVGATGITFDNVNFKSYNYNNDVLTIQADDTTIKNSYIHNTYSYDNSGAHTIGIYSGQTNISNTEIHNDESNSYSIYVRNNAEVELNDVVAEEMYDKGSYSFEAIDRQADSGQTIEVTDSHIKLVEDNVEITKTITQDTTLTTNNLLVKGNGNDALTSSSTITADGTDITFDNVYFKANNYNNDVLSIQDDTTIKNSYIHNTYNYDNSGSHTIGVYNGKATITGTDIYNDDGRSYALYIRDGGSVDLTNVEVDEIYNSGSYSLESLDKEAEIGHTIKVTSSSMTLIDKGVTVTKSITHDTTLTTEELTLEGDGTNALGSDRTITLEGANIRIENVKLKQNSYNDALLNINSNGVTITGSTFYNTYSYDNSGSHTIRASTGNTKIKDTNIYNDDSRSYALYVNSGATVDLENVKLDEMYDKGSYSFESLDKQATNGQTIKITSNGMTLIEENVEITKSITHDTTLTTGSLTVQGDGTNALGSDRTITTTGDNILFENIKLKQNSYNDELLVINSDGVKITGSHMYNTYSYDNSGSNTIRLRSGTTTITDSTIHNDDSRSYALYINDGATVDLENVELDEMYDKGSYSFESLDKQATNGQTIEVTNSYMKLVEENVKINKRITRDTTLSTESLTVTGDGTNALGSDRTITVTGNQITFDNVKFKQNSYNDALLRINSEGVEITGSHIYNTYSYDNSGSDTIQFLSGTTSITDSTINNDDSRSYALYVYTEATINMNNVDYDGIYYE